MERKVTLSRSEYDAAIFDMDGVVTRTAKVHLRAWKQMFDDYLKKHSGDKGRPFNDEDYRRYVDGKPRYEGVKSFLASRGIELPYGTSEDGPEQETVCGLGNRKNRLFRRLIEENGVEVYAPAVDLLHRLRSAGFKTAVVSSSENCVAVLEAAGLLDLFDVKADGVDSKELGLEGKPSPDIFLVAAERLEVGPDRAVVLEDAISGVKAGERGHFALVIGVDRTGHGDDLKAKGADIVVTDLSTLDVENSKAGDEKPVPSALDQMPDILTMIKNKKAALFLDYDGTLTPIVDDPESAFLSESMRQILVELADLIPVAVISGRDLPDVQKLVSIETIYYAGSHGFDIAGPWGMKTGPDKGAAFLPALDTAEKELQERIDPAAGARVERKKFSIAVHYRNVAEPKVVSVKDTVEEVAALHRDLRMSGGKKIFELQPKTDWHKGKALLWLLGELELDKGHVVPFYIGDDVTDEDAFKALKNGGIGIVVMEKHRPTAARYRLRSPHEVERFLKEILSAHRGES
jgi:trehalose 6-phosphate phosphatase